MKYPNSSTASESRREDLRYVPRKFVNLAFLKDHDLEWSDLTVLAVVLGVRFPSLGWIAVQAGFGAPTHERANMTVGEQARQIERYENRRRLLAGEKSISPSDATSARAKQTVAGCLRRLEAAGLIRVIQRERNTLRTELTTRTEAALRDEKSFVPNRILQAQDISDRTKWVYGYLDAVRSSLHARGVLESNPEWRTDPDAPSFFAFAVDVRDRDVAKGLGIRDVRRDLQSLSDRKYVLEHRYDDGSSLFWLPLARVREASVNELRRDADSAAAP